MRISMVYYASSGLVAEVKFFGCLQAPGSTPTLQDSGKQLNPYP